MGQLIASAPAHQRHTVTPTNNINLEYEGEALGDQIASRFNMKEGKLQVYIIQVK